MKVRATKLGFHDGAMRHPGQVFEVPEGTKGKWFVSADTPLPPEEDKPKSDEPSTLAELGRRGRRGPLDKNVI